MTSTDLFVSSVVWWVDGESGVGEEGPSQLWVVVDAADALFHWSRHCRRGRGRMSGGVGSPWNTPALITEAYGRCDVGGDELCGE